MTLLVLGSSGQLARHLQQLLPEAQFWGRATLDLGAPATIEGAIMELAPAAIVNAAAYTSVDRAESEPDLAWRLNAEAPAAIARAAARLGAPLVHFSTDYVFDGTAAHAYRTTDPVRPLNVYGASKAAGELAVATLCRAHWILRTSWVFSEYGANFVKTILTLAHDSKKLKVVDDQHGIPTYAADLARVAAILVGPRGTRQALPFGIYNAVGGETTTWYRYAREILISAANLGLIDRLPEVVPVSTAEYPTAARRPINSVLFSSPEIDEFTGVRIDWRVGLKAALHNMSPAASIRTPKDTQRSR